MIQIQDFPIALVFPPQGHFTQPYLALPCLKAWLQAHGFTKVSLHDASIEAYDHFLSPGYLEGCAQRVARRLPLSRFAEHQSLPFEELEAFRAAAESAASAPALIAGVEQAKSVLRGQDFYEVERYVPAVRTLYHALRLVSAAHFPSQLTPHNFTMRYGVDRSIQVLAATLDEQENPFLEFFRTRFLPRLVAQRPRVLGLSVIYGSQLIPALTLGRLVKQALPDCHVTAGGGFLAYIGRKLLAAPGLEACLDSVIFHEGEEPLRQLCVALRDAAPLSTVGSLGWIDRTQAAERAVFNAPAHPIKLDQAPTPDFSGLPVDKYFSPELVIPYDINRGCYYGECTFCTLPTVIGPGYRTRSAPTIARQVLELKQQLGTRNVNFITDCMPPGMIKDLPEELIARDAGIRWWCDARVEPKAYTAAGAQRLYEAGCRKLLFGFETATPRLLKLMQKGQSLRATLEVARNCADAGISVTFYAMVGFPSETRAEAQATVDFLVANKQVVREVSLQTFHVDEVAQIYREPERFGISILDEPGADLQLYHDYLSDSGMTQTEAAQMFETMMAALRANYPLFAGDNIFFFMQKSHYFLHLARGTKPDDFLELCRQRLARRAGLGARADLVPRALLQLVDLPFSYAEVVRLLSHPLARAMRPEFLTGRFVEGAKAAAMRELGSLSRKPRVLAYAEGATEFAELRPDGRRLLEWLEESGDFERLCQDAGATHEQRASLEAFAAHLHRLGLLTPDPRLSAAPAH